jgi:CubicO group peptidase (beta-lactamase class C family)
LIGLLPVLSAQATDDRRASEVDRLFQPVAGNKTPGAAVLVIRDGQVVLKKAYGMADVAANLPNTPTTRFLLASVTKTFTATAIMQLHERGILSIDDPVSKYLTDFPQGDRVKIRNLLSHTAGLPDFMSYEQALTKPLEFEPGSRVSYSNIGYQMLGKIIEKVSGKSYEEYLQDNIFKPAGMGSSGMDRDVSLNARACGYLNSQDGFTSVGRNLAADAYSAGALFSTVDDMALWNQALESAKLLKPETLQQVFTPSRLSDGREAVFGLGWMIGRYKGVREIHHGGDITGFSTEASRFPDQRLTVIVLSNIGMRPPGPLPNALDLSRKIAEIYVGDQMKDEPEPEVIKLDPTVLDLYVGEYEIEAPEVVLREGGRTFTITREGDRLMGESKMGKGELLPESETVFQAKGSPVKLTFIKDLDGKVTRVLFGVMGVREFPAHRIK